MRRSARTSLSGSIARPSRSPSPATKKRGRSSSVSPARKTRSRTPTRSAKKSPPVSPNRRNTHSENDGSHSKWWTAAGEEEAREIRARRRQLRADLDALEAERAKVGRDVKRGQITALTAYAPNAYTKGFSPSYKAHKRNVSARWQTLFEVYPKHLREGPWSPVAYLFLFGVTGFLVSTAPRAIATFPSDAASFSSDVSAATLHLERYRYCGVVYCLGILALMLKQNGLWPLTTYTIWQWSFLTARFIFTSLGTVESFDWARKLAVFTRFPALVGNTITVLLWWVVLVPIILLVVEPRQRRGFVKFNKSFMLLNVHLMVLPVAAYEFLLSGSRLVFFDFWIALTLGMVYMIFYLLALDRRGIHLYIILTPRHPLCAISYTLLLLFHCGFWFAWNSQV